MKKRMILIPVCVFALITGCFLFLGQIRRNEISDILARQLSVNENAEANTSITSSDTTYNWVHRSLDFSIGVNSDQNEVVSAVFVFTGEQKNNVTIHTKQKKLQTGTENIFTASLPYQKLSKGDWLMSAYLLDQNNHKASLKNPGIDSSGYLAICTFHVR